MQLHGRKGIRCNLFRFNHHSGLVGMSVAMCNIHEHMYNLMVTCALMECFSIMGADRLYFRRLMKPFLISHSNLPIQRISANQIGDTC